MCWVMGAVVVSAELITSLCGWTVTAALSVVGMGEPLC